MGSPSSLAPTRRILVSTPLPDLRPAGIGIAAADRRLIEISEDLNDLAICTPQTGDDKNNGKTNDEGTSERN
jgi:hypothetical protein